MELEEGRPGVDVGVGVEGDHAVDEGAAAGFIEDASHFEEISGACVIKLRYVVGSLVMIRGV